MYQTMRKTPHPLHALKFLPSDDPSDDREIEQVVRASVVIGEVSCPSLGPTPTEADAPLKVTRAPPSGT
jgi:hypothetical protein